MKYEEPIVAKINADFADIIRTSGEVELTNEVNGKTAVNIGAKDGASLFAD